MNDNFEKLFSNLKGVEPSESLASIILERIEAEAGLLKLKRHLLIFVTGLLSSAVAFVFAFKMVQTGFAETGFSQYFSLLFSDFNLVVGYWQSYFFTLLESLPVVSLAVFLAVILIFLELFKLSARELKLFLNISHKLKLWT